MKSLLYIATACFLVGCERQEPPEFSNDHLDSGNVDKIHDLSNRFSQANCVATAILPNHRPITEKPQFEAPDTISVRASFESEGLYDFETRDITTIKFFVIYSIEDPNPTLPITKLSFFAVDNCLHDEKGHLLPREEWPFSKGSKNFVIQSTRSFGNGPTYNIVSYSDAK